MLVRAQAFADVVATTELSAIYVTQFQRTQQTAPPTATASGLTPTQVDVVGTAESHGQEGAQHILANHKGGSILVVGHSDTVPWIIHDRRRITFADCGSGGIRQAFRGSEEVGVCRCAPDPGAMRPLMG